MSLETSVGMGVMSLFSVKKKKKERIILIFRSIVCLHKILSFSHYILQENSGNVMLHAFNIIHTRLKPVFFFDASCSFTLASFDCFCR